MNSKDIVKLLILVFVLIVMVGGIVLLLSGRGGELMDTLRNSWRFGR
jgi:hypothetical protein